MNFSRRHNNPDRPASQCRVTEIVTAPMTGSARQIAWGQDIRNRFASQMFPGFEARFEQIVSRRPYAGWWIERREMSLSSLIREDLGVTTFMNAFAIAQRCRLAEQRAAR